MPEGYCKPKPKAKKKKLTADAKAAQALLELIAKRVKEVASLRDKIREELEEYEAILSSMEEANELMLEGKECIESAIDAMSQYA